jgi:CubicO group peptidase (beta-lactamase class C family)
LACNDAGAPPKSQSPAVKPSGITAGLSNLCLQTEGEDSIIREETIIKELINKTAKNTNAKRQHGGRSTVIKERINMKLIPGHCSQRAFLIGVLFLVGAVHAAPGQTRPERIDALMKLYQEYGQFDGTVLVAEKGKVIYKKGFGLANREWNIPNRPDTRFRLGSITKQFTSMLVLQLVRQGKLKLDGKISEYLPDYPKKTGDRITLHHLLTHTSGIMGYTEFPNFFRDMSRNPSSPEEFVKTFADSALLFEPGAKFSYSNSGYFLLGVIIEKVSGKTYEQLLQENILGPVNMNSTGYDHHATILKKRASGYRKDVAGYVNAEYLDMSLPYSAGSLYSTVEDLYLWDRVLYTDKLLPASQKELLFTPHIPSLGGGYGYGWVIANAPIGNTNDSVKVIEHGGGINGFNTLISRIPSNQDLVVLLNNTGGAPLGAISRAIRGILYDKPYDLPKKSLADAVLAAIHDRGIAAGLELYRDLKQNHSDTYVLRENEMNLAGYNLLRTKKVQEAIEIFKLNVEAFPNSFNVYDSLGEAYKANGDTALAIKNYQKSVELNPNNADGIETLKKLRVQ